MNKQQFNVYLSESVIREIKHAAIDVEESLSQFVETSLVGRLRRAEAIPAELFNLLPIIYVTEMKKSALLHN